MDGADRHDGEQGPEAEVDPVLSRVIGNYLDRLIDGERFDPDDIRREHPELAEAILAELTTFADLVPPSARENGPAGRIADYQLRRAPLCRDPLPRSGDTAIRRLPRGGKPTVRLRASGERLRDRHRQAI